jgi:sugar phosphate isomerase/epimerase
MRLGYNTNGFPHHEVQEVAAILAGLGYEAIAITPDVFHLDPFGDGLAQARALAPRLVDLGLAVAVETGARFVLDRRRKHQPTLLSGGEGAGERLDMLRRCHEIAVALGAETFSFWAGAWGEHGEERQRPNDDELLDRLCVGTRALLDDTAGSGPTTCFEPEPGMAVASLEELDTFLARLDRPELAVMLDVGHVPVTESVPAHEAFARVHDRLGGLQLDDSRDGVHEHLMPGDGQIDFGALFATVEGLGFEGLACLELPRHGHDPVRAAALARERLQAAGLA